ncbi:hypothetical protein L249_7625 [Ophiocordyceps polyrhachis-furcata BCC 54312]|uniref:Uncharacterized protein n=1 Tax=Ophiocordyceps polyrhachis-furcata BCC 54312 TaxID=1330021 RepID=A0A367LB46_9HYPO|nr:hypothetical protein L249_7625 [Ophiocordyceps polyrhachis-furcata BCC 54312]
MEDEQEENVFWYWIREALGFTRNHEEQKKDSDAKLALYTTTLSLEKGKRGRRRLHEQLLSSKEQTKRPKMKHHRLVRDSDTSRRQPCLMLCSIDRTIHDIKHTTCLGSSLDVYARFVLALMSMPGCMECNALQGSSIITLYGFIEKASPPGPWCLSDRPNCMLKLPSIHLFLPPGRASSFLMPSCHDRRMLKQAASLVKHGDDPEQHEQTSNPQANR